MRIDKIKTYLGFSIRSGGLIFGSDKLLASTKMPKLVLICSSQNDKVSDKVIRFCTDNNIESIKLKDILLSDLVGRDNCKVVGIVDQNLAKAIKNEFQMGKENKLV